MSVLAQGTHIFFLDTSGGTPVVTRAECATNFTPGGDPADQIEDTCLEDSERSYKSGLRTPGQATMGLNADPKIASHITLYNLSRLNPSPKIPWAVGWSDGEGTPGYGSAVKSVSVDAGGSGYSSPTVTFSDPEDPNGVKAEGTVETDGDAVTGITITNPGSGYRAAPTVSITGSGTGATATATLDEVDLVCPDTRTWFKFRGYVSDFPFDFSQNTVVTTEVSIQRSGSSQWIKKATT